MNISPWRKTADLYPCHQFVGREALQARNSLDEGITEPGASEIFPREPCAEQGKMPGLLGAFLLQRRLPCQRGPLPRDIRQPYEVGCAIQKKRLECAILVQACLALGKK
jgi:uncharacterized protein